MTQPFETRRLRQIFAYDVSTTRYSEKSSIMTNRKSTTGFPTSYRWSSYIAHKSPKESIKNRFFVYLNKIIQLQSNKVCYNISLCENSSSSIQPFPYLTVHRYWRET